MRVGQAAPSEHQKDKKKYQSAWRMDIIHAGEALGMFTPEGFLE